jgi:hypothetical protein
MQLRKVQREVGGRAMPADRTKEFLAALERLRQANEERLRGYASGQRHVLQDGLNVTEEATRIMKAELAQIEWLIEQVGNPEQSASNYDGEV